MRVQEGHMKKEAGLTRFEMLLLLLGGIVTFTVACLAAYSALVHWNVH